jgi:hypothetical protein
MVNKLSHGNVPLNHIQSVKGSEASFSISSQVLEKGPLVCSAEIRTGTYYNLTVRQAGAFLPMGYAILYTPKRYSHTNFLRFILYMEHVINM